MPLAPTATATRLVDDVLLANIAASLDEHGIHHDDLVEGPPHLNANVTDRRNVFVKVTRAAADGGAVMDRTATETAAAAWAHRHGIDCAAPLLPEPLAVADADGAPRNVTVLDWVDICSSPALLNRCLDAVDVVDRIASIPPPPGLGGFPLDTYLTRVQHRLAGRADTVATAVRAAAETTHCRVSAALADRPQRWVHADLHLANLGWLVNGRPAVLDWESSAVAPVEVDLAQIMRSIDVYAPQHDPRDRAAIASSVVTHADETFAADGGVDWGLVAALARFRSASAASFLLVTGHDPTLLRANLTYLERPQTWL